MPVRGACAVLLLALALPVRADHLGQIGPVVPIAEPDLLKQIHAKLEAKQASGEIERKNREAAARVRASIEHPLPVPGVGTTEARATRYVDPTYTAPGDLTDNVGRVIIAAGTRVNPLDTISLSKRFLFIDARDTRQMSMAKNLLDRQGARLKIVLTAGSYMELMRAWNRRVYYDQAGELVRKLGITRVPALMGQEGRRLRIDEFPPGEEPPA